VANGTVAQGSTASITVSAGDFVSVSCPSRGQARIEHSTDGVLNNNHAGNRRYGPLRAGAVSVSAVSGDLLYATGTDPQAQATGSTVQAMELAPGSATTGQPAGTLLTSGGVLYGVARGLGEYPFVGGSAGFAGRAAMSQSGTGALKLIARIPIRAVLMSGSVVRVAAWASKVGTAANFAMQVQIAPTGASSGYIIGQRTTSAANILQLGFEAIGLVGARGANVSSTTVRAPAQNIGTTGLTYGENTAAISSTTAQDLSSGADILISIRANSDDVVTFEGADIKVSSTQFGSLAIACYGDSLTLGSGSTAGLEYPMVLSRLQSGAAVQNMGVSGQTSAQIAARSIADVNTRSQPHIFQMGRNDVGSATLAATVLTNARTAIAALDHTRYLIGSITPTTAETIGTSNRTAIIAANAALAAEFGARYVDTLGGLIASGGGAEIPGGWYSDGTHFNDTGYAELAAIYSAAVTAAGW
jgi:lysophospholipase L1-like esterase